MKFSDICKQPSVVRNIHESCFRSYQILELAKEKLARGWSSDALLDLIDTAETAFSDEEREEFEDRRTNNLSPIIPSYPNDSV